MSVFLHLTKLPTQYAFVSVVCRVRWTDTPFGFCMLTSVDKMFIRFIFAKDMQLHYIWYYKILIKTCSCYRCVPPLHSGVRCGPTRASYYLVRFCRVLESVSPPAVRSAVFGSVVLWFSHNRANSWQISPTTLCSALSMAAPQHFPSLLHVIFF